MKKTLCCLLVMVFTFQSVPAQMAKDWGAFNQRVDARPYAGKNSGWKLR